MSEQASGPVTMPGGHLGSNRVRRDAVLASRQTLPKPGSQPPVWQPWETLVTEAEQRVHMETREALAAYLARIKEAGRILDSAVAMSSEARDRLEAEARATYHRLMEAGAKAADTILDPALVAYRQEIAAAHGDFLRLMDTAKQTYDRMLADAERAKRDNRLPENLAPQYPDHPARQPDQIVVPPLA